MQQYGAKILSFGRALPKRIVSNQDLEQLFETSNDWIVERTGIHQRHIADINNGENTISLASQAAQAALINAQKYSKAEIKAEDIDLIICATATGDYLFPSTACMVQAKIGAVNAVAFDISAACTGYIFALNTAYNYIRSGQFRHVLVIGADLMSKFVDWSDRRTAIIFGDGAGATLLTQSPIEEDAFSPFYIRSRGDSECSLSVPIVSNHYPQAASEINVKPTMVHMDGQSVYQFAVKAVPEALEAACRLASVEPNQIDYFIPHQANLRIIDSAARRFKIPLTKFICNLDHVGNTSAASIPIAIDEALELGTITRNSDSKLKLALVGFGAGLTWGSVIVKF